jgi:hypothetical protein
MMLLLYRSRAYIAHHGYRQRDNGDIKQSTPEATTTHPSATSGAIGTRHATTSLSTTHVTSFSGRSCIASSILDQSIIREL